MSRNRHFCPFSSFLIVSLILFINKLDSLRDLIIFKISHISWFEITSSVIFDPKILFWIAASVAVAAAVNPNGIKTLLANDLSTSSVKGKQAFSNSPKSLPGNPPDYTILCNWVFENFIWTAELFATASRNLKTCVLVDNNIFGKSVSSLESPTTFHLTSFKRTWLSIFILDF